MNTLLLTTNTTNCTTKNLKMMAAVICMTAVFVFTNVSVFAQGFSNSEGKTTVTKTEAPAATYNNYKGIADKNEAKKAWLQDHPEENVQGVVAPEATKPAVSDKEVQSVKNLTPVTSNKQVVTPQSAETIDNAIEEVTVVKSEINVVENTKAETLVEVKVSENQPYLNYKGIRNPKEARKLWMAENPEAAAKLAEKLQQGEANQKVEPVQKTIQK